jgi:hypothetical protein
MAWFEQHLSDEALLLVTEGELSSRRLVRARTHLDGCQNCRTRLERIERTLATALELQSAEADRPLPPAAPARARLARQMAERSARPGYLRARPTVRASLTGRRWLYGAAVVLVALASGLMLNGERRPSTIGPADASGVFLLPRTDLTPGATAPVALRDICGPDRDGRTRPISTSVHQAVFARYGADYRRAGEYELDHLITPELGGVADARNLWPQPFTRTPWNAYVKDELERLFHRLVCEGQIELVTAQREMASDWIAAYKRYFNTESPLRDYEASPLTALDRELILSELEELGVSTRHLRSRDGAALMGMLRTFKEQSDPRPPRVAINFAVFRPHP